MTQVYFRIPPVLCLVAVLLLPSTLEAWQSNQKTKFLPIKSLVESAIDIGDIPGAVVLVGTGHRIIYKQAFGNREVDPELIPLTTDTVFDLASLTKPIATATSIMKLVEDGKIRIDDRVAAHLPEFGENGKDKITIRQLLTHTGGLLPDNALGDYNAGPETAWSNICKLGLRAQPGEKFIYTDVGFIVLGKLVQHKSGLDLNQFSRQRIFQPLRMHETGFLPSEKLASRAAPTEKAEDRWMKGHVHDPRASRLDGIAGHAGIFSTADDLAVYCQFMLGSNRRAKSGDATQFPLARRTIELMTSKQQTPRGPRGLGWDIRSPYASNRSDLYSDSAFGHGGFTGTSLWIDPELDLFVVVLSSRLYPDGKGQMNHMASKIGSIAVAALDPGTVRSKATEVLCGIDVLQREDFKTLAGKRVGLITNQTGVNLDGTLSIKLLSKASNVNLVRIFSPEHGLKGLLDIPKIDSGSDSTTGLEVFSLYGETKKPTPASLENIDVLVFDIQDIGTRFYTYISTMGLAIEAAAESGVEFVVLDRPNPIGGTIVSGPVLDEGSESFVGFHTLPVRHGMTAGEIAKMLVAERYPRCQLNVIRATGWNRDQVWDETGLVWVNPSPNMRNLTQAILYPGVGLLEMTNISVGRGTDTPFEVIGAPWIEAREFAEALNGGTVTKIQPGVRFVPIRFTPKSSKHVGKRCQGVNIVVTDRSKFQSVESGMAIAQTLRELYPNDWELKNFNRLLSNKVVFDAVSAGTQELEPLWKKRLLEFKARRAKYLLY